MHIDFAKYRFFNTVSKGADMIIIKQILEHNYNNFLCGVVMSYEMYRSGRFSRKKMSLIVFRCFLERMKLRHWTPQSFDNCSGPQKKLVE